MDTAEHAHALRNVGADLRIGTTPHEAAAAEDDVLVRVDSVSKKFCRSLKRSLWYGVCDIGSELLMRSRIRNRGDPADRVSPAAVRTGPMMAARRVSRDLRRDEFWAVDDMNFVLRRGECLGLIGHNGAGKTTLLKMLNGLVKVDRGRIEMRGRTGALIALGAGFNPLLTGRENIYVNGSVLGLTRRQIDARMDEILDFSEIGEFADTPVQNYSSGMSVRLGFAVAAVLIQPDVLLLDEVLAVGDIGFTIKCLNRVRRLTERAAVIFVSHNMQYVSAFCTRVIVMENGRAILDARNPAEAIDRYYALAKQEEQESGSGDARVLSLTMCRPQSPPGQPEDRVVHGESMEVRLDLEVRGPRRGAHVQVYIFDETISPVMCFPITSDAGDLQTLAPGRHALTIPLGRLELSAGKYSFTIAVTDVDSSVILTRLQGLLPFRMFADKSHWGKIVRPAPCRPS